MGEESLTPSHAHPRQAGENPAGDSRIKVPPVLPRPQHGERRPGNGRLPTTARTGESVDWYGLTEHWRQELDLPVIIHQCTAITPATGDAIDPIPTPRARQSPLCGEAKPLYAAHQPDSSS